MAQQRGFTPDNSEIDWIHRGEDNGNLSVWLLTLYLHSSSTIWGKREKRVIHIMSYRSDWVVSICKCDYLKALWFIMTTACLSVQSSLTDIITGGNTQCSVCVCMSAYVPPAHKQGWVRDDVWCVLLLRIYVSLTESFQIYFPALSAFNLPLRMQTQT